MLPLVLRLVASLAGVAGVTVVAHSVATVNAATAGFAYLILVLLIASTWGFVESAIAAVAATLTYNFYFFPPVGAFTIADPHNWVALFSFLTTSLVASRLSTKARQQAREAEARRQDVERLYTFSRAILLIEGSEAFPKDLTMKLAEVFDLSAAVLFDRRSGEFFRAGPLDFEGLDEQLRDAALNGTSFSDPAKRRVITAVRLGSEPIGGLALQGSRMPDAVLQGIANLVAIGLERARAQDLAHQVEVAKQSEQLRTTLIDAMAHEFKTPLTSIRAATSSMLSTPDQPAETRIEMLRVADEEAEHLRTLIDDAVEMARLDTSNIEVHLEPLNLAELLREVILAMQKEIDSRPVVLECDGPQPVVSADQRLVKLAIRQLVDNALKYSAPATPLKIGVRDTGGMAVVYVSDRGRGIPPAEQSRLFERFWRSPSVRKQIPGTGLGLSIAYGIARAHAGDLTVSSQPGETIFQLKLPIEPRGEQH